jgi:predicted alpha/beta-fold hydrolase
MHFRGASHEPNRLTRAYHAGDSDDFSYLLEVLNQREPHTKKAAIGISLGGNVLLKWLGETPNQTLIQTAVAISPPFQLELLADKLNRGFGRVYQAHLLKRVRGVHLKKRDAYPSKYPYTQAELNALKTFWAFDNKVTAPLHAFADVHSYYKEVSSRQYLNRIQTPTLIIHALDDPFIPVQAVPHPNELSSSVSLELSKTGGHVGFIRGNVLGKFIGWMSAFQTI